MAKPFNFGTVINPLAIRTGLIDLRGHRVPLPGIVSPEPLLRGCDHRAWFDKLLDHGIRHVMVPLNALDEDTSMFARRHPKWAIDSVESSAMLNAISETSAPKPAEKRKRGSTALFGGAVYDLEHRDEGFFARLKFLLEAADAAGVLVGLSLFDVSAETGGGPFRRGGNLQGLAWEDLILQPELKEWETLERLLKTAGEWIATAVRARRGVWISAFRGQPPPLVESRINTLGERLTWWMGQMLVRPGEDQQSTRHGPWIAGAPGWRASETQVSQNPEDKPPHLAPFDLKSGHAPELDVTAQLESYLASKPGHDGDHRRPLLYYLQESTQRGAPKIGPELAWRCMARGYFPIVPAGVQTRPGQRRCAWLSQLALFFKQWVGKGFLRPCPEILANLPEESVARGPLHAASDGCGRFFIYFEPGWLAPRPLAPGASPARGEGRKPSAPGIRLSLLPGAYRFFWFDPQRGKGLDNGDGISGGQAAVIPGIVTDRDAVLVVELEELPDPLSVW
ncbi:MAG TPA: hypothetical protein VEJ63_12375 [Planctomycetota bacterium]|nr:hypothetical protein [Planctomycetota bacterium]